MVSGENERFEKEVREIVRNLVGSAKSLIKLAITIPAAMAVTVSKELSKSLSPRYRVEEDEDVIRVEVELPGVRKDSVRVFVRDRELYVRAERDPSISTGAPRVYRARIELPDDVDPSGARARYVSGLLIVELPKKGGGTQIPVE